MMVLFVNFSYSELSFINPSQPVSVLVIEQKDLFVLDGNAH